MSRPPRAARVDTMTNDVLNEATTKFTRLRRSRQDRMVAGVCGGAAKALGVDAALLRILLVAATLLGFGLGAVLYLAAWILVPDETP
jgi:phage shock protein PspC (stress-responsive transcriptional regulator)